MRPRARRRLDLVLILLGALAVGAVAVVGAFAGDTERIAAYWTHAHVDPSGAATVVEVIDYDFGSNRRHGLLRQIPDVSPGAPFTVSSPTAPDDLQVFSWWSGTELRVGDPFTTISNRHRYTLEYPHDGLVSGDRFAWNAVGDGWAVDLKDVEVHVTADVELLDPTCDAGRSGSVGGCTVETVAPGHLVAHVDESSPGEFVTVRATLGPSAAAPTPPTPPTGPAPDPGTGWKLPGVVAAVAALAGGIVTTIVFRRAGREWMWDGGATAAAFGPDDGPSLAPAVADVDHAAAGARRVDQDELAEMTTIEFEPPRELSAALGGVVHVERVLADHKTAWLLESAIRDEIQIDTTDRKKPVIRRGSATPNPTVGRVLDTMFGGAASITLGKYDADFAKGWQQLDRALGDWQRSSGLWDRRGRTRRIAALVIGAIGLVVGGLLVALFAGLGNQFDSAWIPAVAAAGVVAGLALGAIVTAWELRIRTPAGSGAWIRIESFRRFLHDSEAEHVERAAAMGLLRQYTAWAAALGETDHWEKVVAEAAAVPGSHTSSFPSDVVFASTAAHAVGHSVTATATAPSSSGGGGGGGAGGGGGGGGGGSW